MEGNKYKEIYEKVQQKFYNTDAENPIKHELIKAVFKKRSSDAHKGNCGKLLIAAGSPGLSGAGALAANAALRSGCGLVTLACQKELNPIYEVKLTEAMTMPVKSNKKAMSASASADILKKLKGCDALLFGPGLSREASIRKLLFKILKNTDKPVLIDADGLFALKGKLDILTKTKAKVILTPHIGEFSYLTGFDTDYISVNAAKLARDFSDKYKCTLILKSHKTVVATGRAVYENVLGNPGMATGGSGDVLSGITASLLAQGNSALLSSLAGVYIHSLAADMANEITGEYSLIPGDIIETLSHAIKQTCIREI